MNKKGFTTVELIVSFSLVAVIVFFLFEIVLILKDIYISSGIKTKLITKQAILTESINNDFVSKNLLAVARCTDAVDANACVDFTFSDGVKRLIVNRENNTVTYNDITTKLIDGSRIGNIKISSETSVNKEFSKYDGILTISVPIYHNLIEKENFGINIIHQYNSSVTSVANVNITDIVEAEKEVFLIGSSEDIKLLDEEYVDPGFYVQDNTNNTLIMDLEQLEDLVKVTGKVGNNPNGIYYKTYTIYDMNGNIMSQVTRQISVVSAQYLYNLENNAESLTIPITGRYKVELWGASGGGSVYTKGLGGYTVGEYIFNKNDTIYINVGKVGGAENYGGSNNGGGKFGESNSQLDSLGFSGGGGTDIRLNTNGISDRIFVAGGGGGGGGRDFTGTYEYKAGAGGGTTGGDAKGPASYIGHGATSTAGGIGGTNASNGALWQGGAGANYTDNTSSGGGGGGGGYYGGGGGGNGYGGGGGSSYCAEEAINCTLYSGTESIPTIDDEGYETGHNGDGYVKITLISLITE